MPADIQSRGLASDCKRKRETGWRRKTLYSRERISSVLSFFFQEDAQEFLAFVLQRLHSEFKTCKTFVWSLGCQFSCFASPVVIVCEANAAQSGPPSQPSQSVDADEVSFPLVIQPFLKPSPIFVCSFFFIVSAGSYSCGN